MVVIIIYEFISKMYRDDINIYDHYTLGWWVGFFLFTAISITAISSDAMGKIFETL